MTTLLIIILIILIIYLFSKSNTNTEYFTSNIPKVIYQTYHDKSKIPRKVFDNIRKYASDYEHVIFDDAECIKFLKENYDQKIVDTFINLKNGAHKADLFRYCILYKRGGVYLDIKTELIMPLSDIFTQNYFYTCLTYWPEKNKYENIYQGIIATPPNHPIFPKLISHIVQNANRITNYLMFVKHMKETIDNEIGNKLHFGLNGNYYLFEERVLSHNCKNRDRYGLCSDIYDGNKKIIKTRYEDYPWK